MARGESPVLSRTIHDSPRLRGSPGRNGSPSRQHLADLELQKTIARLNIHDSEQHKVYVAQKCAFQEGLDAREEARAVSQLSQIEAAIASHQLAREQAEAVLQAHVEAEREKERQREAEEKRRQEEEERRKQEAARHAKEEQERRVREQTEREEAAKRAEAERLRLEEERRQNEAKEAERLEEERQKQQQQTAEAEAQAQAQAQAAKQQQEEAKKAATPAPAPAQAPVAAQPSTTSTQATASNIEQEHQAYLNIHKRLKKFRIDFWENCKSNKPFKSQVGEWRRAVRTAVGQLRLDGIEHNKVAMQKVWAIVNQTLKDTTAPRVPVNDYLPTHHALSDNTTSVPSLTIYILSILSKAIINVTITSCIDNPKAGEAPGVLAAQIFAHPDLSFTRADPPTRVSLISILLAKYHASAPMLFGISGLESSQKSRIGWKTTTDPSTGRKAYVPEQTQYDRLVGLAAGYAAISLRNFSKAKNNNPYPPRHFWTSLAYIVNTAPEQIQVSHLILLKSLLENSVERVVQFFGATGVAALRQALVVLPGRLPQEMRGHATVKALGVLREKWAKDLRFHLT